MHISSLFVFSFFQVYSSAKESRKESKLMIQELVILIEKIEISQESNRRVLSPKLHS